MNKPEIKNIEVLQKDRKTIKLKITAAAADFEAALKEAGGSDTEKASKILMQSVWEILINTEVDERMLLIAKDYEVLCAETGKDFVYTLECLTPVDVELGDDYKKLKVQVERPVVPMDEIDDKIKELAESKAEYIDSDKAAEIGDVVIIDFKGSVNGEYFEGGSAKDHKLKLGTRSFVGNFEDQLVGHKAGEDVQVNITFPEQYAKELAGKDAVFECHINNVRKKQVPELTEAFIKEQLGFKTMGALKADVRKNIYKTKLDAAMRQAEDEVMKKLAASADIDVDDIFIEEEITRNLNAFERELSQHGMNLESFLQMSGKEIEQFREELRPAAVQSIKVKGVIDKISLLENVTVTEEEIESYIREKAEESAAIYELEVDYLIDFGRQNKKGIIKEIVYNKTLDLIRDKCIELVDKKK